MTWPQLEYSKNQVKTAGKILRRHATEIMAHTEDEVIWAERVARNWRRAHAEAENWAQMGCRSRLVTLGVDGNVTQRLKELPTIVAKLVREGNRVQLSTMEDVAGARTVVGTIDELRRLESQWLEASRYPVVQHRDHIDDPPASGYRAVHLVMRHKDRLVEVQLRTHVQNDWADLVEDLGHVTGHALKNGEGPPDLLARLADLADTLAAADGPGPRYAEMREAAIAQIADVRATVTQERS